MIRRVALVVAVIAVVPLVSRAQPVSSPPPSEAPPTDLRPPTYAEATQLIEAVRVDGEPAVAGPRVDDVPVVTVPSDEWAPIAAPTWLLDKSFAADILATDAALTLKLSPQLIERLPALARRAEDPTERPRADAEAARPALEPRLTIDLFSPTAADPPDDRAFLDVVLVGARDRYHCTGVLVAPDVVLTAAHCAPADRVAVAQSLSVVFARVKVTETIVHPTLDAALLMLAQPIPIPVRGRRRAGRRPTAPPVGMVRVVGFGVDDLRHPTSFGIKRRADTSVSRWGCDRARARVVGCRPDDEMVLTAVGGGDTCQGDSGGPVLEPVGGEYRLLAITSRATASGGAPCGRGGIYVRVDVLDGWLTTNLEKKRR